MATIRWWKLALWASIVAHGFGLLTAQQSEVLPAPKHITAKQAQLAQRFLAQRSLNRTRGKNFSPAELLQKAREQNEALKASANNSGTTPLSAPWTAVGPSAVETSSYGLITGRITSLAVDPSDSSGNTVYVGSSGGGIWKSTNAAGQPASVSFSPLTDTLPISSNCSTPPLASLSIGALTVQPNGTGVILAGTGDPNDALDSYYGTGILRSTDKGNTWCLIPTSMDIYYGSLRGFSFRGMGFSGFAWSTVNSQLVVAAVAQSREGAAVGATSSSSFAGLYYSIDAGQTWRLATIEDSTTAIIQSAQTASANYTGNSATSVTWNPVRKRFYAAVQYHGYYESSDGVTWTRLANQPGINSAVCPTNPNEIASSACPLFRGTIAAQPATGDLFAISVDNTNSDQGLWQDVCSANAGECASPTVTFSNQISDAAIDTGGGTNIPQGDYDLTLAAVPSQQDTLLFVGTRDIFRCNLANSCAWRNTTNVDSCGAAQVAPSQHAFDTTLGVSGLMYFGNDGGLWRTTDAVNQQQPTCSSDDAAHFENLNGGIGSLAEIAGFSQHPQNQNVMMAAMGAFGTAALQVGSTSWTQILDGEGDVNAIDSQNPQNWYATSASPVDINLCTQGTACDKSAFGTPVIGSTQVGNDSYGLTGTAPWILDPQNTANLIIGTCRVWRGPAADGSTWTAGNAISTMLDTVQGPYCNGNAQIRWLAASGSPSDAPGAAEQIYAGMAGSTDGGAPVAGHVYGASVSSTTSVPPTWNDLANSPVQNSSQPIFNDGGFDVSSIYVDPHDPSGKTLYVALQGFITASANGSVVYRSVDGGSHWITIQANLPNAPANSILVDPNDANTLYVALDTGVYVTRNINLCTDSSQNCWSPLGTGLPGAPVTQLQAFNYLNTSLLRASTYGRGIWEIPLLTSGVAESTATLNPSSLTFAKQVVDTQSSWQNVTVRNTGTVNLTITSITVSENFAQQNNCTQVLSPGGTCTIQVSFAPAASGPLQGVLTVFGNVSSGQITATLSGTGLAAGNIILSPTSVNFGNSLIGTSAPAQNITISNTGGINVNLQTPTITGDFQISANTCGTSLAPNSGCTVSVIFKPTVAGGRAGVFSISDDAGTQTVQLSGYGQAAATAVLSGMSLNFSQSQTVGTKSSPQQVMLTNNGDVSLTDIAITVSGDFAAQNNCGSYLVGHASCAISVVFVPTKVGSESGTLGVNTVLGSQSVALSGTGLAPPGISALPTTVNFGGQAVNSTSTSQRVVLTNNGGSPLTDLAFSVSGDYAIAGSNCAVGQTLNAQSSCYIDVTFAPSQAGPRSGSLTVSSTNLSTPLEISLTGTGEDFQLIVSSPSSSVIVSGQTATFAVQAIPVNGSSGTLTMGCTGVPQNASCTVNPASLEIGNGVTGNATVTVTTGITPTSSAITPFDRWRTMGVVFGALLPFLSLRKRSFQKRAWLLGLVAVSLWLVLLAPMACGVHATGGGTATSPTPPQGPTTPSGIYTLNITAAIPGLQRNVPVTVTIQ
ncbi:choice-of-anchor D domain-containing protein [Alloacidobacterium dinghuense]|uniref:Choice-of-anchor D domain-containing protein n=1 Tax=Alloacidobacterium dinghuense TaxID=2763107 RepID=A0A7G8BFY2_9BACT|nr:choice-of-anchor D domain-containing protein [Alloacidobacterium dinghuense]QNI31452.1 choice-of-anchor D domain-containing protein [Alloacidobacterium dinghuense]